MRSPSTEGRLGSGPGRGEEPPEHRPRRTAEDLAQETFIRHARAAHRIEDPARSASYVRSIVVNLARDHNRRGLVSLRHRPSALPDETSAEEAAGLRALRYFHELGIAEIAQTLSISPNSVKTHLSRGLAALARTLGEAP